MIKRIHELLAAHFRIFRPKHIWVERPDLWRAAQCKRCLAVVDDRDLDSGLFDKTRCGDLVIGSRGRVILGASND